MVSRQPETLEFKMLQDIYKKINTFIQIILLHVIAE